MSFLAARSYSQIFSSMPTKGRNIINEPYSDLTSLKGLTAEFWWVDLWAVSYAPALGYVLGLLLPWEASTDTAQCSVLGTCLGGTVLLQPQQGLWQRSGEAGLVSIILQSVCQSAVQWAPDLCHGSCKKPTHSKGYLSLWPAVLGLGTARASWPSSTRVCCCLLSSRASSQDMVSSAMCSVWAAVGHCAWEASVLAYCVLYILLLIFLFPQPALCFEHSLFPCGNLQLGSH